jgi:hypothetical protein
LISTIYNVPIALHGSRIRMLGGEMKFTHIKNILGEPALTHRITSEKFRTAKVGTTRPFHQRKQGLFFSASLQLIDFQ